MKIRNPSPEEIVAYERAAHESQGTMLDMSDFEIVIRGKYGAAPGVSIQPDGKLVVGERVVATLMADEMATLLKLRLAADVAGNARQRALHVMRALCTAPHFAQLNTEYKWVTPDTGKVIGQDMTVLQASDLRKRASGKRPKLVK